MGYYSDVAIQCEKNAFEKLKPLLDKLEPTYILRDSRYDVYQIRWEFIKWYWSFDEVNEIESMLDYFDEEYDNEEKLGYSFMRLGESDDDFETRQNCDNLYMWLIRDIGTDFNYDEKLN